MKVRHRCGGINRRHFLAASAGSLPLISALSSVAGADDAQPPVPSRVTHVGAKGVENKLGAPGLYPGRVLEVQNPAMIRQGVKNSQEIKRSLDRGLIELTGAPHAVDAWRQFFEPGDVVGIKVVPNGQPHAHSSFELVLEVIEGLKTVGVKSKDIFVFDRYRDEFLAAGYDKILPGDIQWGGLTPEGGNQFLVDFPSFRNDPIAGYDPDAFVWMDLIPYGDDPKDERKYRSHMGKLISRVVNKIVGLPVLKDHGSAGVTGALKNMSHGSVNNVARSHSNSFTNVCNKFIPQVVSHPIIRSKYVLQIMDGIRGVYQGGPFALEQGKWTWEYNSLFLATDPVALDHVEWEIIDAKRLRENLPRVGAAGRIALDPLNREEFDVRQPQHIPLAGALGLGLFDSKSPRGRRFSMHHETIQI